VSDSVSTFGGSTVGRYELCNKSADLLSMGTNGQ